MKDYLKALLKYILTILLIFILSNVVIVCYNLLLLIKIPASEVDLSLYFKELAFKSLYISIFSSLIISTAIYGLFQMGKLKNIIFAMLIPLAISTGLMAINYYLLKPDREKLTVESLENGRLYLIEGAFMRYREDIPTSLSKDDFELLLKRVNNEDDRQLLKANYQNSLLRDSFSLKKRLFYSKRARLLDIFYKADYFDDIYFQFGKVYKNHVRDVIYFKNGNMLSYKYIHIDYSEGLATLKVPGSDDIYSFDNLLHIERNILIFPINELFEKMSDNFFAIFFIAKDKAQYLILLFWFSLTALMLSLLGIIGRGKYPLFALLLKLFTLFIYIIFINLLYENIPAYTVSIWSSAVMTAVAVLITLLIVLLKNRDDRSNS